MNAVFDALRGFQSQLLLALHGISEDDLRRAESGGRWSIADVIAHLGDLELAYAVRIRQMLASSDETPLFPLEQDAWIERVHRREPPAEMIAELLEQFWFHRRMNLALLERLTDDELQRTGKHAMHGVMSIGQVAERLLNHDAKHLAQIERIKSGHGLRASEQPHVAGVVAGETRRSYSPGDGVHVREVWAEGVKRALEVEIDAGAQWPGIDYHVPGPEEVYILSGDLDDGANVYRSGTFLHHPAGSSHSPKSVDGCKLFVFYPEG